MSKRCVIHKPAALLTIAEQCRSAHSTRPLPAWAITASFIDVDLAETTAALHGLSVLLRDPELVGPSLVS